MSETLHHKLQEVNLGMVWLDSANRVTAFNDVAWEILAPAGEQTLGVSRDRLHGLDILQLHPERSREKLALLLKDSHAVGCPVRSPPPVTMMINIPDRVLLLKVSKMFGAKGMEGTCMAFYDLTDITTVAAEDVREFTSQTDIQPSAAPRRLRKIPVFRANRLVLIDPEDTVRLDSSDHYTSIVTTKDRYLSNQSLSDLEARLDPDIFFRCHRGHIVNLNFIQELERDGDNYCIVYNGSPRSVVPVSRQRAQQLKELLGLR